jgi:putative ABC transport system substrate-binding protein
LVSRRVQITSLAAQYAVLAIYAWREYVTAGGLISYGVSLADATRDAGIYAGRILNGNKPADLPVLQAGNLELAINLRAANEQRISIPEKLLVRADEVIE